mgnify:CR=1 FL=1
MNKRTKTALRRWCLYGWTFAKWTVAASAIGVVCGLIGTMFHFGVHEVTAFRGTHPWVLYLLPLAGFVIVSFYKLTETISSTRSMRENGCLSCCCRPSFSVRS